MNNQYIKFSDLKAILYKYCEEHRDADMYYQLLGDFEKLSMSRVVHCGECSMWDRDKISCEGLAKCVTGEGGIHYRTRNDFCSRGIRLEVTE